MAGGGAGGEDFFGDMDFDMGLDDLDLDVSAPSAAKKPPRKAETNKTGRCSTSALQPHVLTVCLLDPALEFQPLALIQATMRLPFPAGCTDCFPAPSAYALRTCACCFLQALRIGMPPLHC